MNDEFGNEFMPTSPFHFRDYGPILEWENLEAYGTNSIKGPIQQELQKWRNLEIRTHYERVFCGGYESLSILGVSMKNFLLSLKNWDKPAGTTIVFHFDSIYTVNTKRSLYCYSSVGLIAMHPWLLTIPKARPWQVKLLVCKRLKDTIRPHLPDARYYRDIRQFLKTHEAFVIDEEIW